MTATTENDSPFHTKCMTLFDTVFANYHALEPQYTNALSEFNDESKTYDYVDSSNSFKETSIPVKKYYAQTEAYASLFTFGTWMEVDGEIINKLLQSTVRDGSGWKWESTNMMGAHFPEPLVVQAAEKRLKSIWPVQYQAMKFFKAFANAQEYETKINEIKVKPADW